MRLAHRPFGSGPPVVWLHGYTMDSSTWGELWSLLPGWTHVGVDLPGHGRSEPIPDGTSLADAAADIAAISREYGATRLVALSFGTILALQVALDHPDVAANLTLSAPALGGGGTEPGADVRYVSLMKLFARGATRAELADEWMTSPPDIFRGTETKAMLRFRLRSVIMRHSWAELARPTIAGMLSHRHTDDDLARLTSALLVVVGDHEMPVTDEVSRRMERLVPDVTRLVVPDAGHLAPLEQPRAVAPLIAEHLTR